MAPPRAVHASLLNTFSATCGIAGIKLLRMSPVELVAARSSPQAQSRLAVTPQMLRHADEQTVVAFAALSDAIADFPGGEDFSDWGVVGASSHCGQSASAGTFKRFDQEGASSVSVQIVPHSSLHSLASSIALGLKSHGPALGAGGDQRGIADAFLTSMALLNGDQSPGVWLILTGRQSNRTAPDGEAADAGQSWAAIVMALVSQDAPTQIGWLDLIATATIAARPAADCSEIVQSASFPAFFDSLSSIQQGRASIVVWLNDQLRIDLDLGSETENSRSLKGKNLGV